MHAWAHWRDSLCNVRLTRRACQGCGQEEAGDRAVGAAVGAGAVVLSVLRGGLPPPQHPQGLPPAARAQRLPQAPAALRASPGRAQDLTLAIHNRTHSHGGRGSAGRLRTAILSGVNSGVMPLRMEVG